MLGFVLSLLLALVLQVVQMPDVVAPFWPLWLPLALAYWALYAPGMPVLLAGWLLGLCSDVLYDAPLGQYALGFVTVSYVAQRLRNTLAVFPLWQSTLIMVPVWALFAFLMFWIDGLTHHSADPLRRWLPVVTTSVLWPFTGAALGGLRGRPRRGVLP
ncbi:MAG: rod shape-determining protein MreD [Nevskia sp.]|nr:rod shape-determining protein MreD [Nevskia sp.]